MASRATCLEHGCRVTPQSDKYGGYCYKHRNQSPMAHMLSPGSVLSGDELSLMKSAPPISGARVRGLDRRGAYSAETISSSTGMSISDSRALVISSYSLERKYGDMRIPANATPAEDAARELRDEMIKEGVDESRVSLERFRSANRMTMSGKVNRIPNMEHEVLVLDRGTDQEKIIDPSISKFAPLRDRSSEVDDELPSGVTPFGDAPWVGDREDYMKGSFLWWDHDEQ